MLTTNKIRKSRLRRSLRSVDSSKWFQFSLYQNLC